MKIGALKPKLWVFGISVAAILIFYLKMVAIGSLNVIFYAFIAFHQ